MKTVLLAVEGTVPEREILGYALGLCRRITAELHILHILDPRFCGSHIKKLHKQIKLGKNVFESSMAAAAFAENGEHDTALGVLEKSSCLVREALAESGTESINCRLRITCGETHREILRFVRRHRDIILTVYHGPVPAELSQKLSVPLVIPRRQGFNQENP
ncbi:MAG: universal stress protein [Desulfosalsimonadaceae bacterium]